MVLLIDAGANVDSRVDDGPTPLFFAARDGWLEAARVLLRANANPLLITYGSLPLEVAVRNGHFEVAKEIVQWFGIDGCTRDGGTMVLVAAASEDQVNTVTLLYDAGVVDTEGMALCAAVEGRSEACVKLLLEIYVGNVKPVDVFTPTWHAFQPSTLCTCTKNLSCERIRAGTLLFIKDNAAGCWLTPERIRHQMLFFLVIKTWSSAARPWSWPRRFLMTMVIN